MSSHDADLLALEAKISTAAQILIANQQKTREFHKQQSAREQEYQDTVARLQTELVRARSDSVTNSATPAEMRLQFELEMEQQLSGERRAEPKLG